MRLHTRDASATRAALLDAATRLFTVQGFDRTTTREIAALAGVNVSLIARYFGGKDGLFAAVVETSSSAIRTRNSDDLVGDIIRGLTPGAWPEFGDEHPLTLLLRPDTQDARTAALRRNALREAVDRLTVRVRDDLAAGPAEARLRGTVALALVAGVASLHAAMADDAPWDTADAAMLQDVLSDALRGIGLVVSGDA